MFWTLLQLQSTCDQCAFNNLPGETIQSTWQKSNVDTVKSERLAARISHICTSFYRWSYPCCSFLTYLGRSACSQSWSGNSFGKYFPLRFTLHTNDIPQQDRCTVFLRSTICDTTVRVDAYTVFKTIIVQRGKRVGRLTPSYQ